MRDRVSALVRRHSMRHRAWMFEVCLAAAYVMLSGLSPLPSPDGIESRGAEFVMRLPTEGRP